MWRNFQRRVGGRKVLKECCRILKLVLETINALMTMKRHQPRKCTKIPKQTDLLRVPSKRRSKKLNLKEDSKSNLSTGEDVLSNYNPMRYRSITSQSRLSHGSRFYLSDSKKGKDRLEEVKQPVSVRSRLNPRGQLVSNSFNTVLYKSRERALQSSDRKPTRVTSRETGEVKHARKRSAIDKTKISPVKSTRNFDLSYGTHRFGSRWPDTGKMTSEEIKKAFENLLSHAKVTEDRMREILENDQISDDHVEDSTDERCTKANSARKIVANREKKLIFSHVKGQTSSKEDSTSTQELQEQSNFVNPLCSTIEKEPNNCKLNVSSQFNKGQFTSFNTCLTGGPQMVNKSTNTERQPKGVKLLKKELRQCSKALQNSIQISSDLLKEVHRLDDAVSEASYDLKKTNEKNKELALENEELRKRLLKYESSSSDFHEA
ncbi:unnamed protein product [Moneuplotes crassus]|uniref:Uncharacterized protein n=1 Tax=Euplotes crassus TaxID=5936 RepID=A0AAD1TZN5_EUPCR|nr:unnamed protein product [Moneuplotes crassus]